MIEVIDRIPTHPGRVKLVPVEGQENTFDMVRADEPIEVGTPINKALFDSMQDTIAHAVQTIDNKVFEMSQRVEIGNLADGSPLGLYENGVLIPYYKVNGNYEKSGRVLVIRADITHLTSIYTSAQTSYIQSAIDTWLNGEFLRRLDTATQSVLGTVPVPVIGGTGATVLNRKSFLLSFREYSITNLGEVLGSANALFASTTRRISAYNGTPTTHFTRDTIPGNNAVGVIGTDGMGSFVDKLTVAGIRPALTLPATFEVTAGMPSTANVNATAEVI